MQLFSSLAVSLIKSPVDPTAAAVPQETSEDEQQQQQQEQPTEATFAVDAVLFAGGPVWALDWAPAATPQDAAAGPLQAVETLAVATHPRTSRRNPVNVAQQGPGVVQVREAAQKFQDRCSC
jgi:general transcription factor 3C polypeptide 2